MASGLSDGSEIARIFLVTNIPPTYGTERGLKNCFRQYSGQEGPQIEYSKVRSPDNNTEAALVTVEGLSSDGAHDALQQKMLLGGRTLNVSHVCSESVTLKFCDVDGHLSQTMQKIATRMGLHFITSRKEVYVCGPFDLLHQFRMDLRAEIFVTAQCSNITPVIFQSVQTTMAIPKKTPQLFNAPQEIIYSSVTLRSDENPPEQQMTMNAEQSPFLKQKTMENDTYMVIDNLSPDVLQLLDKIPEGDIPGVQYNPSLGTVTIQGLNKAAVEETASKFEAVYETILAPGPNQFQVDIVQLDKETDINEVLSLLNELNHQYVCCAFVHSEDTQMIKILSNSMEQIEQAKEQLLDELKQPNTSEGGGNNEATDGVTTTTGKGSVQDFSTKLKSGHTITIKKGDISKESASVLVTMINDRFQCIGEMAAAINTASKGNVQQKVQEHARNQRSFINIGDLVVTRGGGALKYKKVYHVVCPDVTDGMSTVDVEGTLNGLIVKVLSEAERQKVRSVVLPSFVSTVFADTEMVSKAVTNAIVDYCYHHQSSPKPMVSNIMVVVGDKSTHGCFARNLVQSKLRDKSVEGKASEVRAPENGLVNNPVMTHMTKVHVHPQPTLGGGGESPTVIDAISTRTVPEPAPVATVPASDAKTPPANHLPTKYGSFANVAASSPRPSLNNDHPLNHAANAAPDISKPNNGSAEIDENCPVCGGTFTTPTASKCKHSFCSQCLNQAMQDEIPLCPVCKIRLEGIQPPVCPLCNDKVTEAVTTVCCRQIIYCHGCLTEHLKEFNQRPNCKHTFGSAEKTQPQSSNSMNYTCLSSALPGYAGCDTIQIMYDVANGIDANGQPYLGASRVAYLPDNIEGREILKLLQRAWKEGLIYCVGPKSEVVWTDIPHKTNTTGGQLNRGYPDPHFFYNVKQNLATKGIVS